MDDRSRRLMWERATATTAAARASEVDPQSEAWLIVQLHETLVAAERREVALTERCRDLEASFTLYDRAVRSLTHWWQQAHPEAQGTLPDTGTLAQWVAGQFEDAMATLAPKNPEETLAGAVRNLKQVAVLATDSAVQCEGVFDELRRLLGVSSLHGLIEVARSLVTARAAHNKLVGGRG